MHQIILLTALTATSGLFGGRHCGTGHCGRQASRHSYAAPAHYQPQCYAQPCATCVAPAQGYATPQSAPAPAPATAPAPAPATAPAPVAPHAATAPQAGYYTYQQGAYYYYPAAPSCATGNCPYR